jgi:ketosteroid isomerase-like protein
MLSETKSLFAGKKLLVLFVLFLPLILLSNIQAQQWSAEQKEVWAGVEAYWELSVSENPMDFLNYFDDSYLGWDNESDFPSTKADVQKWISYWTTKGKRVLYTITPAKIWVSGNFAFVHYYYSTVIEGTDGKPMPESGRWTDILMKKGNKWLMVGDHGGKTSK